NNERASYGGVPVRNLIVFSSLGSVRTKSSSSIGPAHSTGRGSDFAHASIPALSAVPPVFMMCMKYRGGRWRWALSHVVAGCRGGRIDEKHAMWKYRPGAS